MGGAQITSFTYPIYIQATPERVWHDLSDPALMKRFWRHQRAGVKTFQSGWKKGSTHDMAHEEVGLCVNDTEQVILESDPTSFRNEDVGHGVVKLTLLHDGFEPGSVVLQGIAEGWPAVLSSLKTLLQTGSTLLNSYFVTCSVLCDQT